MSKEFKKGQIVISFSNYDGKGTWIFTRAVVKSCGVRQMTLLNAESEVMMGCHFRPNSCKTYETNYQGETLVNNHTDFTLADMSDEEAIAVCLEAGRVYLIDMNEHYDSCVTRNASNASYCKSIEAERAGLHEPRAIKR